MPLNKDVNCVTFEGDQTWKSSAAKEESTSMYRKLVNSSPFQNREVFSKPLYDEEKKPIVSKMRQSKSFSKNLKMKKNFKDPYQFQYVSNKEEK